MMVIGYNPDFLHTYIENFIREKELAQDVYYQSCFHQSQKKYMDLNHFKRASSIGVTSTGGHGCHDEFINKCYGRMKS